MKKVKKEEKSCCSEIRAPFAKRCRYIPALPVDVRIVVRRWPGSVGKRVWGSNLTIVTCGIFLFVTVRKSERDNCNDIWSFRSCVTNVWQDPEASVFRVFRTRLQVNCVGYWRWWLRGVGVVIRPVSCNGAPAEPNDAIQRWKECCCTPYMPPVAS
jgi:hypothetical protein